MVSLTTTTGDESLEGSSGMPAAAVEAALRPLVPSDNESGELDALEGPMLYVEYLHGGDGSGSDQLIRAFADDPRVDRPGGLTVLIGRENVSAGTVVARGLDTKTQAEFVGEPTPARADNFLCSCADIELRNSGFVVTVPTDSFCTGDKRTAIAPDVPMTLASADFFAGRDPVLAAALRGSGALPAARAVGRVVPIESKRQPSTGPPRLARGPHIR